MTATKKITFFTLLAFLISSEEPLARGWGWHRRSAPSDSSVLRPNLEGIKGESEQESAGEVEEMRQWLQQRDDERRQMGITVPDTVEQLEPPPTADGSRWPQRVGERSQNFGSESAPGEEVGGLPDVQGETGRVQDTYYPRGQTHRRSHHSRRNGGGRAGYSRRHSSSGSDQVRRHGSAKSSRHRSSGAAKSGSVRRR